MAQSATSLEELLLEVTERTCEDLAFIFPVPPPEDSGDAESEDITCVQVEFQGPFEGTLALTMPREMARVLAGNMLGLDSAATDAQQREDAAKELCNVVCGNLLPLIAGSEPIFSVSAPHICSRDAIPEEQAITVRSWLCEGWIEAHLHIANARQLAARREGGGVQT